VISRKSHGCSSFLEMLIGGLKKMKGAVFINGKIAYKPEKLFFVKESVE
jgi:translation initiation factor RLI1